MANFAAFAATSLREVARNSSYVASGGLAVSIPALANAFLL